MYRANILARNKRFSKLFPLHSPHSFITNTTKIDFDEIAFNADVKTSSCFVVLFYIFSFCSYVCAHVRYYHSHQLYMFVSMSFSLSLFRFFFFSSPSKSCSYTYIVAGKNFKLNTFDELHVVENVYFSISFGRFINISISTFPQISLYLPRMKRNNLLEIENTRKTNRNSSQTECLQTTFFRSILQ